MSIYARQVWCTAFPSLFLSVVFFCLTDCVKNNNGCYANLAIKNKELEIKQIELKMIEAKEKEHYEVVAKHE